MKIYRTFQNILLLSLVAITFSCLDNENLKPTPAIVSVQPNAASPGEPVLLLGGNFSATASENAVTFGGVPATVAESTPNSMRVVVPDGAKDGLIIVTVNGESGGSISDFDVLNELTITSVFPSEAKPLDTIIVNGIYFDKDVSKNTLTLNDLNAQVVTATGRKLEVVVPVNAQEGDQEIELKANNQTTTYSKFKVSATPPFYFTEQANSGVSGTLNKVSVLDDQTAFVVGSDGTVLKTSNAGVSWSNITTPDTYSSTTLRDVHAINANTLLVCGSDGVFIKTTDGGANWTSVDVGTTERLRRLYFVNSTTGWMVGSGGLIYKTINGGDSWTSQISGTTLSLYGVFFLDDQNGWTAGDDDTLLKTSDGGNTWTPIGLTTGEDLTSIVFKDAQTGWITGDDNVLLATTDGGATWTNQGVILADDGDDLNDITLINDVIIAVADDHQTIRSEDAGTTWTVMDRATDLGAGIGHIEGIDSFAGVAIAVGVDGVILK